MRAQSAPVSWPAIVRNVVGRFVVAATVSRTISRAIWWRTFGTAMRCLRHYAIDQIGGCAVRAGRPDSQSWRAVRPPRSLRLPSRARSLARPPAGRLCRPSGRARAERGSLAVRAHRARVALGSVRRTRLDADHGLPFGRPRPAREPRSERARGARPPHSATGRWGSLCGWGRSAERLPPTPARVGTGRAPAWTACAPRCGRRRAGVAVPPGPPC